MQIFANQTNVANQRLLYKLNYTNIESVLQMAKPGRSSGEPPKPVGKKEGDVKTCKTSSLDTQTCWCTTPNTFTSLHVLSPPAGVPVVTGSGGSPAFSWSAAMTLGGGPPGG